MVSVGPYRKGALRLKSKLQFVWAGTEGCAILGAFDVLFMAPCTLHVLSWDPCASGDDRGNELMKGKSPLYAAAVKLADAPCQGACRLRGVTR